MTETPVAFPLTGIFIRFSSKSDVYMATDFGMDTAHVEYAVWKRTDSYNDASGSLAGYQAIAQVLVCDVHLNNFQMTKQTKNSFSED